MVRFMPSSRSFAAAGLSLIGLMGIAIPGFAGPSHVPETKAKRPVVVELYTSQGCSSCPPADAFLGQLASRKDVLAISLPVTYWDMLGWKDTLASEANTRRQKAYDRVLGRGGIYTPQMIVEGVSDVIGSREQVAESVIAARAADMQTVPVDVDATRRQVHITIGPAADHSEHGATIWMFRILPKVTVSIGDGENSGRTINYRNVVREVRAIGMWKGPPVILDLPRSEEAAPHEGIAVVVQEGGYGRIVGAALFERPVSYLVRQPDG